MTTLAIFDRLVVDGDRAPLDGATVEIRRESDNALASTYSDRAGTTPTSPQGTLTSDSGGRATCYMPGGAYKVTVSKDAFSEVFRYVAHGTMGETDYSDAPEYLSVRFTPTDSTPDAEDGAVYYPNAASQLGESNSSWVGRGPYTRIPMSAQDQSPEVSSWRALANTGLWPSFEKTSNTSITQFDGGRVLAMNSATATVVTFPAGILRDDQVATLSGSAPSMETRIANRGTANVTIAVGTGVTLKSPTPFATVRPGRVAYCLYVRTAPGAANLYILAGGEAETISYDNAVSGLTATTIKDALDELKALIDDINFDDSTDVTIANATSDVTESFSLTSANAAVLLDGQTLIFDSLPRLDASGGPIDVTLDASCLGGQVWAFLIEDATYDVMLKRGEWVESRTGDFTASSLEITNVSSIVNIASGYALSGAAIPEGTTVDGSPSGSTVTMDDVATDDLTAEPFSFSAGVQGKINGRQADLKLLPGLVIVRCIRRNFGVEVVAAGATDEAKDLHGGFVPVTASQSADDEMLGRTVLASHGSTPIVLAIGPDATFLADSMRVGSMSGQWFVVERTGAAAVSIDADSGVTITLPDGTTLATAWAIPSVGQQVLLQWRSESAWKIVG